MILPITRKVVLDWIVFYILPMVIEIAFISYEMVMVGFLPIECVGGVVVEVGCLELGF